MDAINSKFYYSSDGVKLHYLEAGSGETILMLAGGGFSANIFQFQLERFKSDYHVIALDSRGHGRSEKVDFGYRVSRLSKDLHDLIIQQDLAELTLIGHSLGAAVAYNYFDLFGTKKIKKFIAIDEPSVLLVNPIWSKDECLQYGAIYEAANLHQLTNQFLSADVGQLKQTLIDKMTTDRLDSQRKKFIFECMDFPGCYASKLYFNNICQDYRDVLTKIDVPTLFVTGKASLHPWQSHLWLHEEVANSKLEIFGENEGGSHFLFVENPEKFNNLLIKFLQN